MPDFSPLDFYRWGHLRTLLYAAPVDNEVALHRRTVDICQTISNCPAIFERMRRSMMRRVEACIEPHGGHFGNLLCTLSAITHKLNVSGHILSCFGTWNSRPSFVNNFQFHSVYDCLRLYKGNNFWLQTVFV
jgi:hypothetical protein